MPPFFPRLRIATPHAGHYSPQNQISEVTPVAIDLDTLTAERDRRKQGLSELEGELRKLEGQIKELRQTEIRTKREVEALQTLIDIQDTEEKESA
jgi:chromosome segregation ATPase